METTIAALIILTVVMFGALTIVQTYLSSQDAVLESWREMEERLGDRARTQISPVGAQTIYEDTVDVTLSNEGDTKLADLDQWDVIVEYDSTGDSNRDIVKWLPYTESTPVFDEWHEHIGEVFEPGILNPGEELTIRLVVSPTVAMTTTNKVTIATPNGISASTVFTR